MPQAVSKEIEASELVAKSADGKRLAEARRKGDASQACRGNPLRASWMRIAPENGTGELLTRMRYHDVA